MCVFRVFGTFFYLCFILCACSATAKLIPDICYNSATCFGLEQQACQQNSAGTRVSTFGNASYDIVAPASWVGANNWLTKGFLDGYTGKVVLCPMAVKQAPANCVPDMDSLVYGVCDETMFYRLIYFGKRVCSLQKPNCEPGRAWLHRFRDSAEFGGRRFLMYDNAHKDLATLLAENHLFSSFGADIIPSTKRIMMHLAKAVNALHGRSIVHWRLSLSNFVLASEPGTPDNLIQITNFLSAIDLTRSDSLFAAHTLRGPSSFPFVAPEQYYTTSLPGPWALATPAVDIWALALIFMQLALGKPEAEVANNAEAFSTRTYYTQFITEVLRNPSAPRRNFAKFSLQRGGDPYWRELAPLSSFVPCEGQPPNAPPQVEYGQVPLTQTPSHDCLPNLNRKLETDYFMDLFKRMVDPDYRHRFTIRQVIDHCFFHGWCNSQMFENYDKGLLSVPAGKIQ
eukprot:gnl/Spiro4/9976_TR5303_c0_g1_i1.p1 gnl/Spiro4/9976_TR5303_c0_g1~~gnl/Spiro4/9976_TR5303_c0_g1_i1.p1  ORF type:complete len:471 (+),score=74.56 gnl/Spiro4/9976_TR5303_c0_g1_i1:53-1414(+)